MEQFSVYDFHVISVYLVILHESEVSDCRKRQRINKQNTTRLKEPIDNSVKNYDEISR